MSDDYTSLSRRELLRLAFLRISPTVLRGMYNTQKKRDELQEELNAKTTRELIDILIV